MNDSDFVFNKVSEKDGVGIYSGGFSIKNYFLKNGIPPLMTLNKNQSGGSSEQVSGLFDSLVIPLPLYYQYVGGNRHNFNNDLSEESVLNDESVLSEDIHDKLLGLVSKHDQNTSKKKTRKRNKISVGIQKKKKKKNK